MLYKYPYTRLADSFDFEMDIERNFPIPSCMNLEEKYDRFFYRENLRQQSFPCQKKRAKSSGLLCVLRLQYDPILIGEHM